MSVMMGLQIVVGCCACVVFDLWQLAFRRLTEFRQPIGHWLDAGIVGNGPFIAFDLGAQPEKNELAVG